MKKMTALFLSLLLVLTMTAALAETDITLWTFPIGDWGNSEKVDEMLAAFNAVHPDIKVTVEYLDYTNGDAQITTAIEAKTTPDIVMEGPDAWWRTGGCRQEASAQRSVDGRDHRRHQRQQRFRRGDLPGRGRQLLHVSAVHDGALHGHQQDRV